MITRDEIAQLTAKGRTALFDELAAGLFPTQEACGEALEVSRRTIQNWRKDDNVPLTVLLSLHSLMEAHPAREFERVTAQLAEVAATLERVAAQLAGIIPAASAAAQTRREG